MREACALPKDINLLPLRRSPVDRRPGKESKYYVAYSTYGVGKSEYSRGSNREGGIMVLCPECETELDVEEEEVDEGEIVSCPECGTDFEVVTTSPLELKAVEEGYVEEEEEVETEDGDDPRFQPAAQLGRSVLLLPAGSFLLCGFRRASPARGQRVSRLQKPETDRSLRADFRHSLGPGRPPGLWHQSQDPPRYPTKNPSGRSIPIIPANSPSASRRQSRLHGLRRSQRREN